jgi:hypothetical protein
MECSEKGSRFRNGMRSDDIYRAWGWDGLKIVDCVQSIKKEFTWVNLVLGLLDNAIEPKSIQLHKWRTYEKVWRPWDASGMPQAMTGKFRRTYKCLCVV